MQNSNSRRSFIQKAVALGASVGILPDVLAQNGWPQSPIQLIVPFSAGGATDVVARAFANGLQGRLGKSVIVDNRTGAGGSIGTAAVARSKPDGLTLTVGLTSSLLVNQFQYKHLPYDPRRDLVLVSQLAIAPMAICVSEKVPATNMAELRKYLASRKGKVAYGSYGNGSYSHLVLEHMNRTLGAQMTHVPYRGETAVVQALLGNEIDLGICSGVVAIPQVKAGKIRVVGITGPQRMEALAEIPTLIEQGMKDDAYRVVGWVGMAAPTNTPAEIIDRLAREAATVMKSDSVKERLKGVGLVAVGNSPQQFKENYDREFQVWKRMFEASGATVLD